MSSLSSLISLGKLPPLHVLEAELKRRSRNKIADFFPDTGKFRRELYAKHLEFFAAGATKPERLFMAGNRVGKTETGAYETTVHATGEYPDWWTGKRFRSPIEAWAAGINNVTTRDVIQEKLLGKPGEYGTGMIPADRIIHTTSKQGLANAVDVIYVRHRTGGRSVIGLKSYEQGWQSFQGTAKHLVWFDEEPDLLCYIEALMRTATTEGAMMLTFTPLLGMSDVVKSFLEPEDNRAHDVKLVVSASWDDVPHLTAAAKASLLATIPEYQRDARTKGVPALGIGAIYKFAESDFVVPYFPLPKHWPRAYGLDVGWNRTAAVWGALDPDSDCLYLYHEHYVGKTDPAIHASALKAPGPWIPGVIDPASNGGSQIDGRNLLELYTELGLELTPAINSVHSGIYNVEERLGSGRLKVFNTLPHWVSEFRKYHRDEKGRIVKVDDHLMDATRYLVVSGLAVMRRPPVKPVQKQPRLELGTGGAAQNWMG